MSIDFCPVVRPTWAEFNDFHGYTEYLEKTYAQRYGIVKVVPPPGWKPSSCSYEDTNSVVIPGPIEQNAYGRGGVYQCVHISSKSMTVGEFRRRTKSFENVTDGLSVQEVQDLFWKNVAFSSPLYAADIKLTLMDSNSGSWNLNSLNSVLTQGMKQPLAGINTAYCYFGSWKSFFCWHIEDMNLSAINFLHSGKPKYWYGIRVADKGILESEARLQFPARFQKCSEHIRHKTTLINPYKLKAKYPKLQIHKQVQYPGEFMLAFNSAYHCGFNTGFNIAEAVNYATLSWLKFIKIAQYCKCRRDSVRISEAELADQLIQSKLKNRTQVKQFFKSTHIQIQENQKEIVHRQKQKLSRHKQIEKDKVLVTKAMRHKKIKVPMYKLQKTTKKIKIKGEEFKIQQWAQCDKCRKWRKIDFQVNKSESFTCKKAGSNCLRKQESSSQYITLGAQKA